MNSSNETTTWRRETLPNGLSLILGRANQLRGARFLINEIFRNLVYERAGFNFRPQDVVVDIGANLGVFLLWAAPQVPQGRIIAVEPLPIVDVIRRAIQFNSLSHAECLQAAIGAGHGTMELEFLPGFEMVAHQRNFHVAWGTQFWSGMWWHRMCSGTQRVSARCMSLGELFEETKVDQVDWLKIDCEGGEYEIFRHATEQDWERVQRVAMEFHEFSPDQRYTELVDDLHRRGFEVHVEIDPVIFRRHRTGFLWAHRS